MGGLPSWLKAADCNSVLIEFEGSNPSPPTIWTSGGIGRHTGLKILWEQSRVGSSPTSSTIWAIDGIWQTC